MSELTVELIPTGPEHIELIRNLYQFYAYESSDWEQEDVEVDGRFYIHDEHLARYWQEPQWSANLILVDGYIAGFLLVERSDMVATGERPEEGHGEAGRVWRALKHGATIGFLPAAALAVKAFVENANGAVVA